VSKKEIDRRALVRLVRFAAVLGLVLGPDAASAQAQGSDSAELDAIVEMRLDANDQKAATQERIDVVSDETDRLLSEYRVTLKQMGSIRIYNGQMQDLIAAQGAERESLREQLDRVEDVARSVTPLMLRMIEALEAFVRLDLPFLIDERTERTAELRALMSRADVTNAEKYRRIMEAYQIENEYGRTIEAYRSALEVDGRELTVDFLRFGRVALVYQSIDQSMAGVWSQENRTWEPLDSSHRSAIRQGLRIARKQAAPELIRVPVPAALAVEPSS
jgi:hypothetical protein